MNIAVVFTKDITEGGAFQDALSISLLLKKNESRKYNFIYFTILKENLKVLKRHNISAIYLPWSNFDRFKALLLNSQLVGNIFSKIKLRLEPKLDRIFKKHNVDLVYFLSPTDLALALNCYNYIFTIWDLCFLDFMEFPEVYINKEFERRQNLYRLVTNKAVAVITDSDLGKRNIVKKYGVEEGRIISLPFLPSNTVNISRQVYEQHFIDISKKYNIGGKYIFYPAQFWPHKNHAYILDGLKLLKERYGLTIHAIFSGSDKGNLSFILKKAKELGIADQIHYIGFAADKELPYLYAQAIALVMPTYFGPTNIPPLEAFAMGCPVLYSDLPGLREQVKDAAILLRLDDSDSLCQGLIRVLKNAPEISTMVENGRKKIEFLMKEDRWGKLKNAFDDYSIKLNCWKKK